MVREITVPKYAAQIDVPAEKPAPSMPLLFADISDDNLLSHGVPVEWLDDVRSADEDSVLELADHLPSEAAEALLELATGGSTHVVQLVSVDDDSFEHQDVQRRFRVMKISRNLNMRWITHGGNGLSSYIQLNASGAGNSCRGTLTQV